MQGPLNNLTQVTGYFNSIIILFNNKSWTSNDLVLPTLLVRPQLKFSSFIFFLESFSFWTCDGCSVHPECSKCLWCPYFAGSLESFASRDTYISCFLSVLVKVILSPLSVHCCCGDSTCDLIVIPWKGPVFFLPYSQPPLCLGYSAMYVPRMNFFKFIILRIDAFHQFWKTMIFILEHGIFPIHLVIAY